MTPAPSPRHQRIVMSLARMLDTFIRDAGSGQVLPAPLDVILSDTDVLQPDLTVVLDESRISERGIEGPPELVVEVLSESTRRRDEITKRHLYARLGVQEYWVVDPVLESVKVYRRAEEGFERRAEVSVEEGGELTTPLLEGLVIEIGAVFA